MKAAILNQYDKHAIHVDVQDISLPKPAADEVLVKVLTAGVNPLDNMIAHGEVRLIVPYRLPLVMGNELVGIVERCGRNSTRFAVGDRVYCRMPLSRPGAFAEYAAVAEGALARVPDHLNDEEAAAVPLTALTALQAFDLLQAKEGDRLFISGGTGSFGAMAIPLAKERGLHVITNGNAENSERVLRLGAERFIDYKKEDYTAVLKDVDCVIDTLGDSELPREFGILKQGGHLVSLRGLPNGEFANRTGMPWQKRILFGAAGRKYDKMAARRGQHYHFIFVHEDGVALQQASDIFSAKHIEAAVDGVFPLAEVKAAMQKVASGGSRGKTVLRIAPTA